MHYKEVRIEIYEQGHMDFSVYVSGLRNDGKREHLGGFDVRQDSRATTLRTAERDAKGILQGEDPDVLTGRVVIVTDHPRGGRHIEKVLENKIVVKKR